MNAAPLPEIREADATGSIARLYADIKAVTGVPLVTLVYRHMATVPGALPWAWNVLRPQYASGVIEAHAAIVREDARALTLAWPALHPAPLSAADARGVDEVLRFYNSSNAVNLVALTALRATFDRTLPVRTGAVAAGIAPGEHVPHTVLPAPVALRRLDGDLAAAIERVSALQAAGERNMIPTLYLHLAHWPELLASALPGIDAIVSSGSLQRAVDALLTGIAPATAQLAASFDSSEAPPDARDLAAVGETLQFFTTRPIPQMIAIGTHLARSRTSS